MPRSEKRRFIVSWLSGCLQQIRFTVVTVPRIYQTISSFQFVSGRRHAWWRWRPQTAAVLDKRATVMRNLMSTYRDILLINVRKVVPLYATVPVASRGCLPPGANVCFAAPTNQISSAINVFFRISDIRVWTNFWGPLLFPSLLFPVPSHSTFPFSNTSPPLKVGLLNPGRSQNWGVLGDVIGSVKYHSLQCKCQFARSGQISEFHFRPSKYRPCTVPLGADAPFPPPLKLVSCSE